MARYLHQFDFTLQFGRDVMLIGKIWLTKELVEDVAAETGTHRTTVARWYERGEMPYSIERLLDITRNGNLGEVHDAWHGWRITRSGELVAPEGGAWTAGAVRAMQLRYHELSALRHQVRELKGRLTEVEELADSAQLSVVSR